CLASDIDQVAKQLNVNRITIWRWIKEGRFDIQRVGREVLIPKWEVELLRIKPKRQKQKLCDKPLK
ncbi:MAG: excisionase family DNA-binding protein, partial [Dehalococcoidia bacterium]|nr:excisionase family DNA-binding protein [Dehalococcoidia bacterium]